MVTPKPEGSAESTGVGGLMAKVAESLKVNGFIPSSCKFPAMVSFLIVLSFLIRGSE